MNHNNNIDLVPPEAMINTSRNINLHEGGRGERGGTTHNNKVAIVRTPEIVGIYQFRLKNNNDFIITATSDGRIQRDFAKYVSCCTNQYEIKSSLTPNKVTSFETFENELFITNGADIPQTWDGSATSTSDITSIPTDWTGSSQPKQMVKHGRGVSERMWGIGCSGNLQRVYASASGDAKDFSDANVITIDIETGDGFGVVGAAEFGDRIICFGKSKAYIIDDTDSSTANWGYDAAQWEGGVANHKLIIKTPTDIVCMAEDGEVYSVIAAQEYGDYKLASLTNPITDDPIHKPYIHRWIRENVKLSEIDKFHGVYDPSLRAIKIFVMRNGKTEIDTALVYFIDRPAWEAWIIHENQTYDSGYSASSSAIVRMSPGKYKIYTGGYSGFVWRLEEESKNDNGNAYYAGFKTGDLDFQDVRRSKNYKRGWIIVQAQGNYSLSINMWIDGTAQPVQTVSLLGDGEALGSLTLGTDSLGKRELLTLPFDIGNVGRKIQFEVFNETVGQDFFVSQLIIDFKPLGMRPS